jgi:hypothetical protein
VAPALSYRAIVTKGGAIDPREVSPPCLLSGISGWWPPAAELALSDFARQ